MERLSGLVDAAEGHFRAILNERDLDALFHLPRGDLVAELLHEQLHYVIALGVDHQSSESVKRSRLKVADHEATTVHGTGLGHSIGWRDSKGRAHGNTEISSCAVLLTELKNVLIQILTEVNNSIFKVAIATD